MMPPSFASGPIAVMGAMREELAGLAARAAGARARRSGPAGVVEARMAGRPIALVTTGAGASNATRAATELLGEHPFSGLIVTGASGGLSPSLVPGSLVVARRVVSGGSTAPAPDPGWLAKARETGGAEVGTLMSAPEMLCTRDSKAAAYAALGNGEPAAVDLETAALARVAAAHGVPYIAVRAISDTALEDLPLDFNGYRDDTGGVDRFRVLRSVAVRPGLIPPLWRLRRRIAICSENLAAWICKLLEREMP